MHRTPASCHALDPCAHMSPHHCTGCPRTGVLLPGCLSKPRLWNPLSSQSSNSAGMCPGTGREAQTDFPPSRMPRTWCHLLSADEEPRLCHQASLTQHLSQGRSNSLYTTVYYHTARHSAVHPAPDIHASSRHCQSSPRSPELVPSPIYEFAEGAVWAPSSGRQCLWLAMALIVYGQVRVRYVCTAQRGSPEERPWLLEDQKTTTLGGMELPGGVRSEKEMGRDS